VAETLNVVAHKRQAHGDWVQTVIFVNDGTIASASRDQTIKFWAFRAPELDLIAWQTVSSAGAGGFFGLDAAPDGTKVVSGAESGRVQVWGALAILHNTRCSSEATTNRCRSFKRSTVGEIRRTRRAGPLCAFFS
jgi:WD40 repeat protein